MELKVRDVFANAYYKGVTTKSKIENMHSGYGCKVVYKLGNEVCGGQNCRKCFNTEMRNLKERDEQAIDGNIEEICCETCNGEYCDCCEDYSNWSSN